MLGYRRLPPGKLRLILLHAPSAELDGNWTCAPGRLSLWLLELLDDLVSTIAVAGTRAGWAGEYRHFIIKVEFDDIACEKSFSVKTDGIAFCASARSPAESLVSRINDTYHALYVSMYEGEYRQCQIVLFEASHTTPTLVMCSSFLTARPWSF